MTAVDPLSQPLVGPQPAVEVARDLARRGGLVAPIFIALGAIFWGAAGAASVAYALAIVVANFLLAALMLGYAARISIALMGVAALAGFAIRLGLIFFAVMAVRDASWVRLIPLGLTLITAHLGLLFWEMRYISGTLAYPGLKPRAKRS